jgi:hypothetical protein
MVATPLVEEEARNSCVASAAIVETDERLALGVRRLVDPATTVATPLSEDDDCALFRPTTETVATPVEENDGCAIKLPTALTVPTPEMDDNPSRKPDATPVIVPTPEIDDVGWAMT